MNKEILEKKIEQGKQVGFNHWIDIEGKRFYELAGIQKWQGLYKLYLGRIAEDKMVMEEYERDEIVKFSSLVEVIKYIEKFSFIRFEQMTSCKGQRIFNPSFD